MQLIFVNRYFWPDESATSQLLGDVAFALAEGGREPGIQIITSRMHYAGSDERLPAQATERGLKIRRVWTSRFGRANLAGRAIDYVTFYLSAAWRLWRTARRGDVVVVKTDPPLLSVALAPVAWLRRAHLVNWLQDIYPEVASALGMKAARLGALRILRDWSLRRAAVNAVLGDVMAQRLRGLGIDAARTVVIPNWADGGLVRPVAAETNALRRAWGLEGKFVLAYSGNLGRAHDHATMLGAMERLQRAGVRDVAWVFIGGGAQFLALQREARERGIEGVQFRPYQPREALAESLSVGDAHLVSLQPDLEGLIVPSKIYGILAAGRPAIFIGSGEGEVARLLAREACGTTVAMGDADELTRIITQWSADRPGIEEMGARARAAFEAHYDRTHAMARWRRLIENVAERRSPGDGIDS